MIHKHFNCALTKFEAPDGSAVVKLTAERQSFRGRLQTSVQRPPAVCWAHTCL